MGSGVKIHHGVDLTYGYKLSIDDGAVIHQGVLLHDRGGIKIGKHVVVGSFARIFSHSYSNNGTEEEVKLQPTVIGDGARIGSHEIIMGGTSIAAGDVVGHYPAYKV
jgi:acetyltransferase-like isoleucine patch superfamily enzyme